VSTHEQAPQDVAASGPAVQLLVENHRAFLRFLERRVGSREVAEDILQTAFGRAVVHADELRDESAVAWFYRVLRNAVTDHFRRADVARRGNAALAREVEAEIAPEEFHEAICGCIRTLAGTLKPEYAEALERVDVEGMAVKDFARAKGITPSNAGVRLARARAALRTQVVASCGTCSEHGCLDCHCGRPAQAG
jgi:RNA polymerase sigma-70 factor (ECF subfamily)